MNWAQILKALKKHGYKGAETLDAVKSWMSENDVTEFKTPDGDTVDIEAAFKATKAKALTLAGSPAASEGEDGDDEGEDAQAKQRQKDAADAARWRSHKAASNRPGVHSENGSGNSSYLSHERRSAKSLYNARVKAHTKGMPGAPVYDNADDAELAGAVLRVCMFAGAGKGYGQADADREIIKGNSPELWSKVQSGLTNSVGGALIPTEFAEGIIWLTEQYGFARRLFRNEPMSGETKVLRRQTAKNTAYWVGEAAAGTASDATFDNPYLNARKVMCLSLFSNELVERSAVSIADLVSRNFAEAISEKIDLAAWSGDGTNTYGGFTGLANSSGVGLPSGAYVNAAGNSWSAITEANLLTIMQIQNVKNTPAWLCSREFFIGVMMRLIQGKGGTTPEHLIRGTEMNKLFPTPQDGIIGLFQGYPVFGQQVASTASASAQKCVAFGDFNSACAIGVTRELRIDTSAEYAFNLDEMTFRGTFCAGINIHGDGRGSTVGPISVLVTT